MKRALIRNSLISLIILVVLTASFSYTRLKNALIDEAYQEIKVDLDGFIYMLEQDGTEDISKACLDFGAYTSIRVTVIDAATGQVLGDSHNDIAVMDNHLYREEIFQAIQEGEGSSNRYSKTLDVNYLYYAKYIEIEEFKIVVRSATPLFAIQDMYNTISVATIIALLISMIIAFLITLKFNNNVIKPINDIQSFAFSIANGDYGKHIYINSYEEITLLSKELNTLSKKLKKSFTKISTRNAQLEAILRSLKHGILVCDLEGKVKYSNENFSKILGIEENIENKNIYNFLFDENIYSILAEVKSTKKWKPVVKKNIQFSDGSYRDYSGYYIKGKAGANKGVLLLVEDVTNIRKLERTRSTFVSNVTHELKTPITCISGYTQTLLNGAIKDEDNVVKFLGIINDETERLNLLVDDILILSDLENDKKQKDMQEVDLLPIAKDVLDLMKQKNTLLGSVDLLINADESESYIVMGNQNKLKQILINLVDNSIKHTIEGSVTIELTNTDNEVKMSVIDTGIGIEEKHHERLFERFYRVDKHRSRETGGTGLGLSIVKHLAIWHGAQISLTSKVGEGTCVSVVFIGSNLSSNA